MARRKASPTRSKRIPPKVLTGSELRTLKAQARRKRVSPFKSRRKLASPSGRRTGLRRGRPGKRIAKKAGKR